MTEWGIPATIIAAMIAGVGWLGRKMTEGLENLNAERRELNRQLLELTRQNASLAESATNAQRSLIEAVHALRNEICVMRGGIEDLLQAIKAERDELMVAIRSRIQ